MSLHWAHEMGHAIHSYLSNKTQPVVYADYVIFRGRGRVYLQRGASDAASALDHKREKKERAYLINHFLEQFRTTLYRQTMFAEFELRMAELSAQGVTLTAEVLCEEYRKLNALYYGDDVVLDDEIALEWARIPHFYYNYYVFQYATGYAAAIALSEGFCARVCPRSSGIWASSPAGAARAPSSCCAARAWI